MYAKVVTASRSIGVGNGLTYEIKKETDLQPGIPVRVPLRNKMIEGIVIDILDRKEDDYDVKQVEALLGDSPLLNQAQLKTIAWMAGYYMSTLRQAMSVWLPATPWSQVLPKDVVGYSLTPSGIKLELDFIKAKKQKNVFEYLKDHDWVSRERLKDEAGSSPAVLNGLREKGYIREERRKASQEAFERSQSPIKALPTLTAAQEAAYELILNERKPSLLFGVTGSGKTEIYAQLIVDAIKKGKQAIVLVPEILLTEHSITRFEELLERDAIAIIHSRLSPAERRESWKRIHRGEISLVIGSRSALFSPLQNLGVVIIDEEHEWTYKNEQTPRYHARDTAEKLCEFSGAKLVLGTATPSLEAWSRAKTGTYHLARLPLRYKEQPLPTVKVIDLAEAQFGSIYPFTKPLLDAIADRLRKGEQTVLFLNRRGVASALLCMQCRRRVTSPVSQLPYTLHHTRTNRPYLLDHTSGLTADVPERCPNCQSTDLHAIGAGTQKIEIILKQQFPQARLIRADSDTIQQPEQMRSMLSAMRNREADILLGTQSVVKGLDLPHVTLAAVVLADVGLSLPHFRAGERIFQLLTQLTGRSGRSRPGEVIIQTFRPQSPEVVFAANHETEKYLDTELKLRIHAEYPPATKMIRLITRGDKAKIEAEKLKRRLLEVAGNDDPNARVSAGQTFFGGGKEWHVLIRSADPNALLGSLDLTNAVVDVDPLETM